uniref:Uncharacterized protein n=1 Tax=Cacopsylla melanoneura TaxID=428564 RepID=A0A8D9BRC8_9HEMI
MCNFDFILPVQIPVPALSCTTRPVLHSFYSCKVSSPLLLSPTSPTVCHQCISLSNTRWRIRRAVRCLLTVWSSMIGLERRQREASRLVLRRGRFSKESTRRVKAEVMDRQTLVHRLVLHLRICCNRDTTQPPQYQLQPDLPLSPWFCPLCTGDCFSCFSFLFFLR